MAKKTTTTSTVSAPAGANESKADAVRNYKSQHPNATPKEIAEALSKAGTEISAGRVSGILRVGKTRVGSSELKAALGLIKSAGSADKAKAQLTAASEAMSLLKLVKGNVDSAIAAVQEAEELRAAM